MRNRPVLRAEIFRDRGRAWRYRVVASNGRKLVVSEAYVGGQSKARRAVASLVRGLDIPIVVIDR